MSSSSSSSAFLLTSPFKNTTWPALVVALAIPTILYNRYAARRRRAKLVREIGERVLILGGSSGIGRAIALQYTQRGARLLIVGRRQAEVDNVVKECVALGQMKDGVLGKAADFTNIEDMLEVRNILKESWNGIDTVIVSAGVSALVPLLEVAGVPRNANRDVETTSEGIRRAVDVSNAALKGNFTGPLVSAVTLIPLLESTSRAPAILLISSLAAVVPAPTRSLYCSTKSASLILYQSLAIEHPNIAFSCALPSTVEGNFRAAAVDTLDRAESTPSRGLKRGMVARRCIVAVDRGEKTFFIPALYGRAGHLVYWLCPSIVQYFAARKYGFKA